jgi:hypothetical protein
MGMVTTLIRNHLVLQPRIRVAKRALEHFLARNGFGPTSVKSYLGLADPSKLRIAVVFPTDGELSRFEASGTREQAGRVVLDSLQRARYPTEALSTQRTVSFHSHETVMRSGGYHNYFN